MLRTASFTTRLRLRAKPAFHLLSPVSSLWSTIGATRILGCSQGNTIRRLVSSASPRLEPEAEHLPAYDHDPSDADKRHGQRKEQRLGPGRRLMRGGQDLSRRYARLERALRGKAGYLAEMDDLASATASGATSGSSQGTTSSSLMPSTSTAASSNAGLAMGVSEGKTGPRALRFVGRRGDRVTITLPEVPIPPADDECCMSGCALCVYDLYADTREAYDAALFTAADILERYGVSEGSWPHELRALRERDGSDTGKDGIKNTEMKPVDPVREAFARMERELAARRAASAQAQVGGDEGKGTSVEGAERPRPEVGLGTMIGDSDTAAAPSTTSSPRSSSKSLPLSAIAPPPVQHRQYSTSSSSPSRSSGSGGPVVRPELFPSAKRDQTLPGDTNGPARSGLESASDLSSPPTPTPKLTTTTVSASSSALRYQPWLRPTGRRRRRRRKARELARDAYEAATWWLFSRW